MTEKTTSTTIRLPNSLAEKIKHICWFNRVSLTSIIKKYCEKEIEKFEKEKK
jgi:hypothetical protein